MASKELTTAVILAITNAERKGINLEPLDSLDQMLLNDEEYIRPLAEAAISTILAALQEPTEGMIDVVPVPYRCGREWRQDAKATYRAMLAASALGEQSE
ncbi:hypothetical protein [Brucella pituitosa]